MEVQIRLIMNTSPLCIATKGEKFTEGKIAAGRASIDLFQFNLGRVFRDMPQPPVESTSVNEVKIGSYPREQILRTALTAMTPPTTEAFAELHDLIKQDAHIIDETSK